MPHASTPTAARIRALDRKDDRRTFRSGDADLDQFFAKYAGQNQFRHHIGVTYVAEEADEIVGFLTVAPASLDADDLPGGRRFPPYPIPVLRIARLATDDRHRGRGLGASLLRFAIELAERMRDELGCVGLIVDAKSDAVPFYERYGFEAVEVLEGATVRRPVPTVMFLPLAAVPPRP